MFALGHLGGAHGGHGPPDAAEVAKIIEQWQATADDKAFAMKTRFFPSGVKIPGVKWT